MHTRRPILLVEDDPHYAILIQRAFEKADATVPLQIVHDGEAAVAYLAGQGAYADRERYPFPVLMLLDLKLPRKSGIGVLTWMQKQGLHSPPVVALTCSEEPADIQRAYELGIHSHCEKPASFRELVDKARMLIQDVSAPSEVGDRLP